MSKKAADKNKAPEESNNFSRLGQYVENHPGCPDDMRSALLLADEQVRKVFD